jgi:hypothetical protein
MNPTNSEKKFLQAVAIFVALALFACALIFPSSASPLEFGGAASMFVLAFWKLRVRKRKRTFSFYAEPGSAKHNEGAQDMDNKVLKR